MARRCDVVVNLGAIMRERGLGPAEVARLCGLDRTHVSKIAFHKRLPSLQKLGQLCVGLNVPVQAMVSFVPVGDKNTPKSRSA